MLVSPPAPKGPRPRRWERRAYALFAHRRQSRLAIEREAASRRLGCCYKVNACRVLALSGQVEDILYPGTYSRNLEGCQVRCGLCD